MNDSAAAPLLTTSDVEAHQAFVDMVAEVRPELFRYCSRMTGSVFDGEDIVQETLAKAYVALGNLAEAPPLKPWLFRIAHNAAMDFLKRYERKHVTLAAELPEVADVDESAIDPELVDAALTRFVALPPLQRSAIALKDVLGHSLTETAATMGTSISAVKAALVRARANLAATPSSLAAAPVRETSAEELRQLQRYATLFNDRNWDALRALMGEESRLEVVTRARRRGAAAAEYYTRYAEVAPSEELRAEAGWIDDRPVLAMFRPASSAVPSYFVLIEWHGAQVSFIRDFRYVPYITDGAPYLRESQE